MPDGFGSPLKSAPELSATHWSPTRYEEILTLSVWKAEAALERFVRQQPHQQAMVSLRRCMGDSAFTRWKLEGGAVSPTWREAMEHFSIERAYRVIGHEV